jgi:hypothetical protein
MQRYAPHRAFPPYRFVPGVNPHPTGDPLGHSYRGGAPEPAPPAPDPDRWRQCDEYLFGCDLYNFAFWWEAHEAWEGLWHRVDKSGTTGLFLQGLIQISASHLKRQMQEPTGCLKLAQLGIEKLRRVAASAPGGSCMGIDLGEFIRAVETYLIRAEPDAPFPLIYLKNS